MLMIKLSEIAMGPDNNGRSAITEGHSVAKTECTRLSRSADLGAKVTGCLFEGRTVCPRGVAASSNRASDPENSKHHPVNENCKQDALRRFISTRKE